MNTLKDIIQFNRDNDKTCLKYGQLLLEECENNTSGKMNEVEYFEGIKEREDTIKVLEKNNIPKYNVHVEIF